MILFEIVVFLPSLLLNMLYVILEAFDVIFMAYYRHLLGWLVRFQIVFWCFGSDWDIFLKHCLCGRDKVSGKILIKIPCRIRMDEMVSELHYL